MNRLMIRSLTSLSAVGTRRTMLNGPFHGFTCVSRSFGATQVPHSLVRHQSNASSSTETSGKEQTESSNQQQTAQNEPGKSADGTSEQPPAPPTFSNIMLGLVLFGFVWAVYQYTMKQMKANVSF